MDDVRLNLSEEQKDEVVAARAFARMAVTDSETTTEDALMSEVVDDNPFELTSERFLIWLGEAQAIEQMVQSARKVLQLEGRSEDDPPLDAAALGDLMAEVAVTLRQSEDRLALLGDTTFFDKFGASS